jgi:hypothetical protein
MQQGANLRFPAALLVMTVAGIFTYILLLDAGVTDGVATALGAIIGIFGFFGYDIYHYRKTNH